MVIKQVKHWIKLRASAALCKPISDWAASRNASFTLTEDGEGFQIDEPKHALGALRVEWGTPQRDYIEGRELRLRLELKLSGDLQMLVIERELLDALERAVFEAYTDTLQTRVDTDTPEEMRWLVMFNKAEHWKSKVARSRFSACAVTQEVADAWVNSSLGEALAVASQDLVPASHAFVMLTQRGNLYLRTTMLEPSIDAIKGLVRLAETAAREAQALQQRFGEAGIWVSTSSAAFSPSLPTAPAPDQSS